MTTNNQNQIQPFAFGDSLVRVVHVNGNPWWVVKDVCKCLGISKHRDALARLDDDERGSVVVDTLGGPQEVGACNESGIYSLIFESRKPEAIAEEIRQVAAEGYTEITLLGQNINTYGWDLDPGTSLGQLLHLIHDIEGIRRIRFLTSHPINMRDDLIDAMAELPKVCEFLHLPLQAGDNELLKRMRRNHTVEFYAELVDKIRAKIPHIVLTSDFIVGFPGETEEQFMGTVESVRRFAFDSANTASYSPRPKTPAARFDEQLSEEEKSRRLNVLNQVVREVALQQNRRHLGEIQEVMVESHDAERNNLKGRTRGNKIVHFEGMPRLVGQLVDVKIFDVTPNTLRGRMVVS